MTNTHGSLLSESSRTARPVWLVDLLSFTPWYTAALAKALVEQGVSLRLHCSPVAREPGYLPRLGLQEEAGPLRAFSTVSRPQLAGKAFRSWAAIANAMRLRAQLRRGSSSLPSVLHLQQVPLLNHGLRIDFSLIAAAHRRGVPVVHTVHNILPHDSGERMRARYAELYGAVDHLICHSGDAAQRLLDEFSVPASRLTIIPHGPLFAAEAPSSEDAQCRARCELGLPCAAPVVLWQGVLAPYKGVDVLLRAWKRVFAQWQGGAADRPVLVIAGTGDAEVGRSILRLAEGCGDSVRPLLRYVRTDELPGLYQAADLLVYPYREITTSGAILTGLTFRKPIIASDLPAFRGFVVHGQNGLLVPPGDSDELAIALTSVLQSRRSRSSVEDAEGLPGVGTCYWHLLAGAQMNPRRYTDWATIAKATASLYQRLASSC